MKKYFTKGEIGTEIRPLYKADSVDDYITRDGCVYKYMRDKGLFLKRKTRINQHNGYEYVCITTSEGNKNRRVHRLIAMAYISNPNEYPIVGHKNNIKHDNRIENLYWTTIAKNTQKAHDDGLIVNDIGIEDSQSNPIACFTNQHKLVGVYGSISEAGRCIIGSSKSSISKVLDKTTKGRKGYYYKSISDDFYFKNKSLQGAVFNAGYIRKKRKKFKATSPVGEVYFSDNQKSFSKVCGISQATISHRLRYGTVEPTEDGWKFEEVDSETFNKNI